MLSCIQFSPKVLKLYVHIYISLVPRHLKKSEERLVSILFEHTRAVPLYYLYNSLAYVS